MMPQVSSSLISLLLVLYLCCTSNLISCTENEVQALLAWRSSLRDPGGLNQMWSYNVSSDPCRWEGILCNHDGSITDLYYDGEDYGPIHGTLAKFNFSSFPNLIALDIYDSHLHGEIPEEIGRLRNLEGLYLYNNNLAGRIPWTIQNLSNLEGLQLDQNNFAGEIPNGIGLCTKLVKLTLMENHISGHIPTGIGNMTELEELDLRCNDFQGEVPTTIAQLSNLVTLYLDDNQLTGSKTPYLGNNNTMLYEIDLSNNNFNGTIPSFICIGGAVGKFYAFNNNFDGLLPNTLRNCTCLQLIDLSNNSIKADISHIFGEHPNLLTHVDFSQNLFYGRLPGNLEEFKALSFLSLQENNISGEIPRGFVNLTQLLVVNLDNNNLIGEIPLDLASSPSLAVLVLSNNNFTTLPIINAPNLMFVHLSNNKFVGEFPLVLGKWNDLVILDLGENNFSGEIPSWIGSNFPCLQFLLLRSNQFNGKISPQLSKLNNLQLMDLSNNDFKGSIPHIFFNMSLMVGDGTSSCGAHGFNDGYGANANDDEIIKIKVIWKGEESIFKSTIDLLKGIDLSYNSFSGEVPGDLMKLQALVFLNLSRNQLSGFIPHNIGNLTWLEVLDLSMNHLSGNIPPSISQLSHLDMLNLSHNKLTGEIPFGQQIRTFNPSIFSDNDGLCGWPLPNNCSTHNNYLVALVNDKGDDHKLEVIWVISFGILGFNMGFWIYIGALVSKASLRFSIFRFTDELQYKMMNWCSF